MSITIKNDEQIEKMRKAGKILRDTLNMLEQYVYPGQTSLRLNDLAYQYIKSQGAIPSFLGYEGFPFTICASVNEQVVHGFCNDQPLIDGDIISIDCGVIYDGWQSDAARTFAVGNISLEKQKLINDTKQSFFEGLKGIKAGSRLGNISHQIQKYLEDRGYGVVRELTGHGIGTEMHEDPYVPNYGKYNSGIVLQAGMTLAIEPMSTLGKRDVVMEDNDWTISTWDGLPAAHYENTVLITKDGVEILSL